MTADTTGLLEPSGHGKTIPVVGRSSAQSGGLLARRLLGCCAIGVGCALVSCGGLAADGLESGGGGPSVSDPAGEPPDSVSPPRETCEDNPLLAGCPRENLEEPSIISAARNVLSVHCGQCHGPGLTPANASASINYIDDWDQLLGAGLIQRCSPERSRIVVLMRRGDMPPPNSFISAVPDADIDVVEEAIDLGCRGE